MESDFELRLADFAKLANRIGAALQQPAAVKKILTQLQTSQHIYATEENELFILLDEWSQRTTNHGGMIEEPNDGRRVMASDLFAELKVLADETGQNWYVPNTSSLSKKLIALEEHLSVQFAVDHGQTNKVSRSIIISRISWIFGF